MDKVGVPKEMLQGDGLQLDPLGFGMFDIFHVAEKVRQVSQDRQGGQAEKPRVSRRGFRVGRGIQGCGDRQILSRILMVVLLFVVSCLPLPLLLTSRRTRAAAQSAGRRHAGAGSGRAHKLAPCEHAQARGAHARWQASRQARRAGQACRCGADERRSAHGCWRVGLCGLVSKVWCH